MKKAFISSFFMFCLILSAVCLSVMPAHAAKVADPTSPDIAARVMPAPMMVVGTYNDKGRTNFGLFDRGGVATSKPATYIAICMDRTAYTYKNIVARKALTINLPSEAYAAESDLFGSFSGISGDVYQDKLAATGLTAEKGTLVNAPMIREFPVSMECELVEIDNVDKDSPFDLLIVKVVKVWLDERYTNESGGVNPLPAGQPGMIFYNPGRGDYYGYYGLTGYMGKPETLGGAYEEKIPDPNRPGNDSSGSSGCNLAFGLLVPLFAAGYFVLRKR